MIEKIFKNKLERNVINPVRYPCTKIITVKANSSINFNNALETLHNVDILIIHVFIEMQQQKKKKIITLKRIVACVRSLQSYVGVVVERVDEVNLNVHLSGSQQ